MIVDFNQMPLTSRVWVFVSNTKIPQDSLSKIKVILESFCLAWLSHQKPIKSSFTIVKNFFIIVSVDNNFNQISGCSIDNLYHCIRSIEDKFSYNLSKKTILPFYENGEISFCEKKEINRLYFSGIIHDETEVINTLVATIKELKHKWHIPFKESWAHNLVL